MEQLLKNMRWKLYWFKKKKAKICAMRKHPRPYDACVCWSERVRGPAQTTMAMYQPRCLNDHHQTI
jgi:hypothetical protein